MPNEFLLVLYDGDDGDAVTGKPPREKGAYYKNIERKMHLKKKRANVTIGHFSFEYLISNSSDRFTTNMKTNGKSSVYYTPT